MQRSVPNRQVAGFTLIELAISLALIGIILASGIVGYSNLASYINYERRLQNRGELESTRNAHRRYADTVNNGVLLSPFDDASCNECPVDITNATFLSYLENDVNRTVTDMNGDSSAIVKIRGMMIDSTTYNATSSIEGLSVSMDYEAAVIVQTDCEDGESCDTTATWASPAYTKTGWSPHSSITESLSFNTLDIMEYKAALDIAQFIALRDSFRDYKREQVVGNPADTTTNFLPLPNGTGAADASGNDPSSNQGCHNGWYDLSAANVNVLEQLSLDASYATTSWGGTVEYCQDFDLSGTDTSTADTVPHVGALRIRQLITSGSAPSAVTSENIFLPI